MKSRRRGKAQGPQRTEMVRFRVTPEEEAIISEKARMCGLTRSRFMRKLIRGETVRAKPRQLENDAIHQLARIGNNLNQLSRHADPVEQPELSQRLNELLARVDEKICELAGLVDEPRQLG